MNSASQMMKRSMVFLNTISKRNYGQSYYITLPEMPDNHIPNVGLMPVVNKFPKFTGIDSVACYFDMGKACLEFEEEVGSLASKLEECGNDMSFDEVLQEIDKSKVYLHTIRGLLELLYCVKQPHFSDRIHHKISERMDIAFGFPNKNEGLYNYFKDVNTEQLDTIQKRILASYLLTYEIEGMHLDMMQRNSLLKNYTNMLKIMKTYLSSIKIQNESYSQEITEPRDMEECPPLIKNVMSVPEADPLKGPWAFSMDPLLIANFFKYCSNSFLRAACWEAMTSRCSNYNNRNFRTSSLMEDIRGYRFITGVGSGIPFHEQKLKNKMAENANNVLDVLKYASSNVRTAYENELDSLIDLANTSGQLNEFEPCDIPYWRRHQLEALIGFSTAHIMHYFPFEYVWSEALSWCSKLLGVSFKQVDVTEKTMLWHDSVRLYEISDNDGSSLGFFYFDPFQRETKQIELFGHFTFIPIRPGSKIGAVPLSAIIGGISYLGPEGQYLLTFENLHELFFMLGCLCQEMLTTHSYSDVHGTRGMAEDLSNISANFFPHWLRNPEFVISLSKHCTTGKPISNTIATVLSSTMSHLAAHDITQQMMISHLDILLYTTKTFWLDIVKELWKHYQPLPYHHKNHYLCSFQSLIVGPTPCNYYCNIWSKMLAADVYMAFKDCPKEDIPALGLKYREAFLRMGGGEDPSELFRQFRGRNPDHDALLLLNNIPIGK